MPRKSPPTSKSPMRRNRSLSLYRAVAVCWPVRGSTLPTPTCNLSKTEMLLVVSPFVKKLRAGRGVRRMGGGGGGSERVRAGRGGRGGIVRPIRGRLRRGTPRKTDRNQLDVLQQRAVRQCDIGGDGRGFQWTDVLHVRVLGRGGRI